MDAEASIVARLKQICTPQGKEESPRESAVLFYELAKVYMNKSLNKTSIIQIVALLNAAICRKPENVKEIKNELENFCDYVFKISEARDTSVSLVAVANEIYKNVTKMRNETSENFKNLDLDLNSNHTEEKRIDLVHEQQNMITRKYIEIMNEISQSCIRILGKPYCKFSLAGMGSLARSEVTPFSDFESCILLEEEIQDDVDYQHILEYFRWYSVLFSCVLLNFKETILPSVAIPCLNDFSTSNKSWFFDAYTPRGICFDGLMPHACKNPLGRDEITEKPWKTELIKPVSEMLKYLDPEVDRKNGFHLADVLSVTCHVAGDIEIHNKYRKQVLQRSSGLKDVDLIERIENDLNSFAMYKQLPSVHTSRYINTKQVIYRSSTLFVSTLGKIHGLGQASCFEIISELLKLNILTVEAAHNLHFAIAIACEIRLKVYLLKSAQSDRLIIEDNPSVINEDINLLDLVRLQDVITYFKVTYCLQKCVRQGLQRFYPSDMRTVGKVVESGILYYFKQYREAIDVRKQIREQLDIEKDHERFVASDSFIIDCWFQLKDYPNALKESQVELGLRRENNEDKASYLQNIGKRLISLEKYENAIENLEMELKLRKTFLNKGDDEQIEVIECLKNIAICYFKSGDFVKSLSYFQEETSGRLTLGSSAEIIENLMNTGGCYFKLGTYDLALYNYSKSKELINKTLSTQKDNEISCFNAIAHCYYKMEKFDLALENYLNEFSKLSEIEESQMQIHDALTNITQCQLNLKDYNAFLLTYEKLQNYGNVNFPDILHYVGVCYLNLKNYEKAITYYSRELDLRQAKEQKDEVVKCLRQIASLYTLFSNYKDAIRFHEKHLYMLQKLSSNPTKSTAICITQIANCYVKLGKDDIAIEKYKKALEVFECLCPMDYVKCSDCIMNISTCLHLLGHFSDCNN